MKVYVLEYFPISISDCNGVFSSFEKAKTCFAINYAHHSIIWKDLHITCPTDSTMMIADWLLNDNEIGRAFIYETEIDIQCD